MKKTLKQLFGKWINCLGLAWWDITINYYDAPAEIVRMFGTPDEHMTAAVTLVDWKYGVATIDVNLLAFEPRRKYQVVFAIGIFYLLRHDREDTVRRLIARMFDLTEEVLAFSALSTWAPEQTTGEHHLDPAEILAFCRSLSPFVRLRHDYHPREFTMFVFKEKYLPK